LCRSRAPRCFEQILFSSAELAAKIGQTSGARFSIVLGRCLGAHGARLDGADWVASRTLSDIGTSNQHWTMLGLQTEARF
jgi:hypothetical protein